MSLRSLVLSSSRSTLILAPNSLVGFDLLILITPPIVFLPKSVPCGPRSTSTDSRSKRSRSTPELEAAKTPSITTPTVVSNVFSKSVLFWLGASIQFFILVLFFIFVESKSPITTSGFFP